MAQMPGKRMARRPNPTQEGARYGSSGMPLTPGGKLRRIDGRKYIIATIPSGRAAMLDREGYIVQYCGSSSSSSSSSSESEERKGASSSNADVEEKVAAKELARTSIEAHAEELADREGSEIEASDEESRRARNREMQCNRLLCNLEEEKMRKQQTGLQSQVATLDLARAEMRSSGKEDDLKEAKLISLEAFYDCQ